MERQELHCHNCGNYVQFSIDTEKDGQHILNCPNCRHHHFRVVRNGKITGDRWGQDLSQNLTSYFASTITYSTASIYTTTNTSASFARNSWITMVCS
jgi:uncharacterized protein YbaR (Trm112 family)